MPFWSDLGKVQCPKCGAKLNEEARFCSHCGAPLVTSRDRPTNSVPSAKDGNVGVAQSVGLGQAIAPSDSSVSIRLEPNVVQASLDEVFEVRILVFTNYEIQAATFEVRTAPGLAVLEYPHPANTIPASDEGFLDRMKVRAQSYGRQNIEVILRGEKSGAAFERPSQVIIRVKAPTPELVITVKDYPNQVSFGTQFALVLHLTNTGKGPAKSLELPGLEKLMPELKTLQGFSPETIIDPGSSIDQPVTFQAKKSGLARMNTLLLSYKDMDGVIYSKDLSILGITVEVITPQPKFNLEFHYGTGSPEGEMSVSYLLTNSGADAVLFRMKAILAQEVILNRGVVTSLKPVFHHNQTERGEYYLRLPSGKSISKPIDHMEIEYSDAESVSHFVKLRDDETPKSG